MDDDKKHLIEDAEKVVEETRRSKSYEVEKSNSIFLRWFYWSAVFLGELQIPEDRIRYFLTAYLESSREVQSSIVLALHGSYKNAVQILRNWLELIVAGIYYDHHQAEGKAWEEKGYYTRFKTFKSRLERDRVLSTETLRDISSAWERLSAYVHSLARVLEGASAKTGYGAVFPEYNESYFNKWFGFLEEIYNLCCILLVEHIPEVLKSEETKHFFKLKALDELRGRVLSK
jgi:hypothetical protein